MNEEKGLIIVYTGKGKGKTTAALGVILRAAGYNKKCLMVQFGKAWFTGEISGIKKLGKNIKIIQGGKGFLDILGSKVSKKDHILAALAAYDILYKEVISNKWDIVVADEIVGASFAKVLPLTKILQLIEVKPAKMDLILTGRFASKSLIQKADLVTEMKEVKHPYQKGIVAKKGIDF
jgi:cob(I)alamin adenosyltransferase